MRIISTQKKMHKKLVAQLRSMDQLYQSIEALVNNKATMDNAAYQQLDSKLESIITTLGVITQEINDIKQTSDAVYYQTPPGEGVAT